MWGVSVAKLWLSDLNGHVCCKVNKLFGRNSKCLVLGLGGGRGGEPSFTYNRGIRFFGCPSHVAEMPAFCMQGTLCKMQHVVLYNLMILSAFSLCLGTSYDDGSSRR